MSARAREEQVEVVPVAGELAIGELAAIPAGDLVVKVGLGRVDPGPPLSVTVAWEWVSDFGIDCGPWNTNPFDVPWQLNHFLVMIIINLVIMIIITKTTFC